MTVDEIKSKYGVAQTDAIPAKSLEKMSMLERLTPRIRYLAERNGRIVGDIERLKDLEKKKAANEKELKSIESDFRKVAASLSKEEKNQAAKILIDYPYYTNLRKIVK